MRPYGLRMLLGFGVLLWLVLYLFADDWVEGYLERTLSSMLGTIVEIDDLQLSLRGPAMGWQRLAMVNPQNPQQNLLETGPTVCFLRAEPLLRGRVVVREVRATRVRAAARRDVPAEQLPPPTSGPLLTRATASLNDFLSELGAEQKAFLNYLLHLDDARARDASDAPSDAVDKPFEAFTADDVSAMIFGETLASHFLDILRYVEIAREYMPTPVDRLAQMEPGFALGCLGGQDISFPMTYEVPEFLMEYMELVPESDTTGSAFRLSGTLGGVTSHPQVYGEPAVVELEINRPGQKTFKLSGLIDHRTPVPSEQVQLLSVGQNLANFKLPDRPYLPIRLSAVQGRLGLGLRMDGDELEFRVYFSSKRPVFEFSEDTPDPRLAEAIEESLTSLELLSIIAAVYGPADDLGVIVESGAGTALLKAVRAYQKTNAGP